MQVDKQLLIDAIIGVGISGYNPQYDRYKRMDLVEFTGNQWNEKWDWKHAELETLALDQLYGLYRELRPLVS